MNIEIHKSIFCIVTGNFNYRNSANFKRIYGVIIVPVVGKW